MTTTTNQTPTEDVIFRAGEFTGRDGRKRNRYEPIGVAWRNDAGQIVRVKLSAIPISWDGNLYFRTKAAAAEEGGAS